MVVIGLTGGIASGKSTVSQLLAERGAVVIDADRLGHEVYQPGTPAFTKVVAVFGPEIIGPDGRIDRQVLGSRVFGDPAAMKQLTAIVWPAIHDLAAQRLATLRERGVAVAVLEAAVLIEAGWLDLVDEVWVVVAPEAVARQRLIARNGLTAEQAEARLRSQLGSEERLRYADVIIENAGTLAALRARVEEAWRDLQRRLQSGQRLRSGWSG